MTDEELEAAVNALFSATPTGTVTRTIDTAGRRIFASTGNLGVVGLRATIEGTATVTPKRPALLLQAVTVDVRGKTEEGALIECVKIPWLKIVDEIQRDPNFLYEFAKQPRRFEEFIAATYEQTGEWDDVILTPPSRDGGRDVIVVKNGFGALRFLEQTKAYSPGTLVTHNDVRAMLGVLTTNPNASKAIITTTSNFQPEIFTSGEFTPFMPHRLETKNGAQLKDWLLNSVNDRR